MRRSNILAQRDDLAPAEQLIAEATRMPRAVRNSYGDMLAGTSRAEILFRTGRREEAVDSLLALKDTLPGNQRIPVVSTLSTYLATTGRPRDALGAVDEILEAASATGLVSATARGLETLAMLLAEAGDTESADRLLGYVLEVHGPERRRTGGRLAVYERLLAALGSANGACRTQGQAWSDAEAVEFARTRSEALRNAGDGAGPAA